MLTSKQQLEDKLKPIFLNLAFENKKLNDIYDEVKDRYSIPRSMTSDIMLLRMDMGEVSSFVLFCILDCIIKLNLTNLKLNKFYSDMEIEKYSNSKYEINKMKFPLVFKMIEVASDQWIGKIETQQLMQMREAQIIKYNHNTQRTMTKIIRGDKEFYKITLNQKAVSDIKESFKLRLFISNTITLNIPLDNENADFYYDKEKCEFVINYIDSIDITDAYHRFIAACKLSDEDHNFNYSMELRITNFSEDKANRFIFQEDQKTKMSKTDSNSFNMNDNSNIIVSRINESSKCNLNGLISRNGGIINFGELAGLIDYFYFKGKHITERSYNIKVIKELIDKFNELTEFDLKYLEKSYDYIDLFIVMYVFNNYNKNEPELIEKIINKKDMIDKTKFKSKVPRKAMENEIKKIEVLNNFV